MAELMLSDLPHIKYHNKADQSEERQQMLSDLSEANNDKIRSGGLKAMKMNLDFSTFKMADLASGEER